MPFISTVTTLQQGAKEPAFLVIMVNTLEPILMTTCFVQIPSLASLAQPQLGFQHLLEIQPVKQINMNMEKKSRKVEYATLT